ncbi:hypothetical protein [Fluviispira vulneris]|uniref:hypothetical protein n=1 Tax=Fluviispira vulneris TaxID=2763012 RepID=UPI001644C8CE|nr:hypothetical protein [Fluviispira vulneris]
MNQAGNDTVGKIPGVEDAVKSTGGISVGVETNGTTNKTYVEVRPNNVPARVLEVDFTPEGPQFVTPFQNLFQDQPVYKKEEIDSMLKIIDQNRNDQADLVAVNNELLYDLTNLSKLYNVSVLEKPFYFQPVNVLAEPVFYISIGGSLVIGPVTVAITAGTAVSLFLLDHCLTHGTNCNHYAKKAINELDQYASQYLYFNDMRNKIQKYTDNNAKVGDELNSFSNNVTVEFSSEPISVKENETTYVDVQQTPNNPAKRIRKRIAKKSNVENKDIATGDKPISDIFSFAKYDLTEERTDDGKIKLIVHIPASQPQDYSENYNHYQEPHTFQPNNITPIYNPHTREIDNSEYIDEFNELAIDDFEYRRPNEIELQFLQSLGYSEADWDWAMNQETPCEPFLKGGPYVLVRALASHCAKGQVKGANSIEVHHMPSQYAIAKAGMKYIGKYTGPSIAMTKMDHKETTSHGRSDEAIKHRNRQIKFIENGEFSKALFEDINEINLKFPGRYNEGISQLMIYKSILETTGYVK